MIFDLSLGAIILHMFIFIKFRKNLFNDLKINYHNQESLHHAKHFFTCFILNKLNVLFFGIWKYLIHNSMIINEYPPSMIP